MDHSSHLSSQLALQNVTKHSFPNNVLTNADNAWKATGHWFTSHYQLTTPSSWFTAIMDPPSPRSMQLTSSNAPPRSTTGTHPPPTMCTPSSITPTLPLPLVPTMHHLLPTLT
mmetsp:Transcript_43015/g.63035  ORF Transcript_43015/g.63035 Transcript_43015/m.63035 type:complete len:113 (+) Transcript_43015:505-843(+)